MVDGFLARFIRTAGLMIPLLFAVGCALVTPAPPTITPPPPSPVAAFTAIDVPGRIIRGGSSQNELEKDSNISIQLDDRIQLDETGRGLLLFQDRLEVGMFRKTELHLVDAREEASGSTFISLFQSYGNTHLRLNTDNMIWVVLKTEYATMTTLAPGTDFVICHKPGTITCGVVNEGAVEFQAEGEKVIAKKGEAVYVKPSEPPSQAICARQDEVYDWLSSIQGTGEVQGLGAIVSAWPQEGCSASAQETDASDGTLEITREGMGMVDEGLYEIGRPQVDDFHIASQEITLPGYWIDMYEVTNAQYQVFMDSTGSPPPAVWPGQAGHPVKGVTRDQAASYCTSVNKRLPSEAEWEVAARGPGVNPPIYPWGDDPTAGGQVNNLPLDMTYPVGSFPFNQSPFGIYDMAGNVWEWVGEPYDPVPEGNLILRGGRHGLIRDSAYRQEVAPNQELFIPYAGIRCAADRVEGE